MVQQCLCHHTFTEHHNFGYTDSEGDWRLRSMQMRAANMNTGTHTGDRFCTCPTKGHTSSSSQLACSHSSFAKRGEYGTLRVAVFGLVLPCSLTVRLICGAAVVGDDILGTRSRNTRRRAPWVSLQTRHTTSSRITMKPFFSREANKSGSQRPSTSLLVQVSCDGETDKNGHARGHKKTTRHIRGSTLRHCSCRLSSTFWCPIGVDRCANYSK